MRAPRGVLVDHIDRNRLDNRRSNLRLATKGENGRNRAVNRNKKSSVFKGVFLAGDRVHRNRPWRAWISYENRKHLLGYFSTEVEAARAYDGAARRLHGAFARVNFPREGEQCAVVGGSTKSCSQCEIDQPITNYRERVTKKGMRYRLGICGQCERRARVLYHSRFRWEENAKAKQRYWKKRGGDPKAAA